jgi:hypothetical protein
VFDVDDEDSGTKVAQFYAASNRTASNSSAFLGDAEHFFVREQHKRTLADGCHYETLA